MSALTCPCCGSEARWCSEGDEGCGNPECSDIHCDACGMHYSLCSEAAQEAQTSRAATKLMYKAFNSEYAKFAKMSEQQVKMILAAVTAPYEIFVKSPGAHKTRMQCFEEGVAEGGRALRDAIEEGIRTALSVCGEVEHTTIQ